MLKSYRSEQERILAIWYDLGNLIVSRTFPLPPSSLYSRRHIEMAKSCTSNKEIRAKHVHTRVHIHTQSCREEANTKTASVHSDIYRCKHTDRNTKKDTLGDEPRE